MTRPPTPAELIEAERAAFAAFEADPSADTERPWLAAREDLLDLLIARRGTPVIDAARGHEYAIGLYGRLARRPLYRGRLLRWSRQGQC